MPQSTRLREAWTTTIRFQCKATVDHVTARLLEAVRRTDLSLLSLEGDGKSVYPFKSQSPIQSALSWRAELLWREGASDVALHLEVFEHRANVFLDSLDGYHVETTGPPPRSSSRREAKRKRKRSRGAYGLDGAFRASSTSPREA